MTLLEVLYCFILKVYFVKIFQERICQSLTTLKFPILWYCVFMIVGVTKGLRQMNKKLNLPQLQRIMMEFERESEIMDLKEELMSDTVDDVIGEADEDEESEAIVQQVLGK